jgi:thymidylate synthase (FAD)
VTAVAQAPIKLDEKLADGPETVKVLDRGFLALDGAFASDLAVANGARVSFNLASQELGEREEGLIRFLMRDRHGSPFEHGYFRFVVKAPIFVVREHHRHRSGHSYNEWSGRYSKMQAEFYVPDFVRSQVGKPGAYTFEPVAPEVRRAARAEIERAAEQAFEAYERLLEQGVAKEVARTVLPLSMYTKYYWSCNPRSLMHFCSLRNSEFAQHEIREYAKAAEGFLARLMPVTHAAFLENGRVAP